MSNSNELNRRPRKVKVRKFKLFFSLIALVLVIALVSGGVYVGYTLYNAYATLNDINNPNINPGTKNVSTEPFTVLFLGVNTTEEGATMENANADSIILATINPQTKQADLLSVPRDAYMEVACTGYKDKITNAGQYGTQCLMDSISTFFDVPIDYYFKIDFAGFVSIVDALGGVEMNVPDLREGFADWPGMSDYPPPPDEMIDGKQWCEQNSNGDIYTICFDQFGMQKLDGEHALAVARTRHYDDDQGRSARQAELIKIVAKRMVSMDGVLNVNKVLGAAKDYMSTNIDASQITNFFTLGQTLMGTESSDSFQMRTIQLYTNDGMFYGDMGYASYGVPYVDNVEATQKELHIMLGTEPYSVDTNFGYDANKSYPQPVVYPEGYEPTDYLSQ